MKFTTVLFLVALAGALVCAQDASSDVSGSYPTEDPTPSNIDQRTTTTEAQEKTTSMMKDLNLLKILVEKGADAKQTIKETEETMTEGAKKLLEGMFKYWRKIVPSF